jgi:hypothetical protein
VGAVLCQAAGHRGHHPDPKRHEVSTLIIQFGADRDCNPTRPVTAPAFGVDHPAGVNAEAHMARRTKKSDAVRLVPNPGWSDRLLAQLQQLEIKPLDARKLPPIDQEDAFLREWQKAIEPQLDRLLRALDIDPAGPTSWRNRFLRLAVLHHGVGHVIWKPSSNQNAAKWSIEHDIALRDEMRKRQGLRELAAIKQIAADPRARQLFPYKAQKMASPSRGGRPLSNMSEEEKCVEVLRARWRKIRGWIAWAEVIGDPGLGKTTPPETSVL